MMFVVSKRAAVVFCGLVVSAGCGSQSDDAFASYRSGAYGPLSEFQEQLLADNELTFGEMESAANHYVDCIEDLAFNVEGQVEISSDQDFGFRFFSSDGNVGVVESPDGLACNEEFTSVVGVIWADSNDSSGDDRLFYEGVVSCLRGKGFDVADTKPDTLSYWIEQQPVEYDECLSGLIDGVEP